jgi:hypothetical protein
MGRQGPDLMSKCTLIADPELRAYLEASFAKLAKPGMCNPDGAILQVDGEPDPEAAQCDSRNAGQRQHDALKTVARAMFASGDLGQHRGLPVSVVATTSLQDLEDAVGQADPASGSEFVFAVKLARAAQRRKTGQFLAEGANSVAAALETGRVRELFY